MVPPALRPFHARTTSKLACETECMEMSFTPDLAAPHLRCRAHELPSHPPTRDGARLPDEFTEGANVAADAAERTFTRNLQASL